MGANHSLPRHRSRPSSQRTSPSTSTSTTTSTTSTPQGSPATTYTTPSSPTTSFSAEAPSNERTSISCEPSTSPIDSRDHVIPLRMGYPYYEEVALEAKRGSRRRSRSLSKVLDHIGFSGSGRE